MSCFCIAFVFLNTVSKTHYQSPRKLLILLLLKSFWPTLACTIQGCFQIFIFLLFLSQICVSVCSSDPFFWWGSGEGPKPGDLMNPWGLFCHKIISWNGGTIFRYNFLTGAQIVPQKCLCDRIERDGWDGAKDKHLSGVVSISRGETNQRMTIKK